MSKTKCGVAKGAGGGLPCTRRPATDIADQKVERKGEGGFKGRYL
jgi:hypothetical protein